jgi:hypothetical protein
MDSVLTAYNSKKLGHYSGIRSIFEGIDTMRIEYKLFAALLLLSQSAIALDEDSPLTTASDTSIWCREISYNQLSANADRLYNWTHSVVAKENTYVVKGHWRVDDNDVYVECRSRIGAPRKYAKYRVLSDDEL